MPDDSQTDPPKHPAGRVRRLLHALRVDDAIRFAVLARLWQLLTGPATQMLIVLNFTQATQDYYSAFLNLLGAQVFVELGLSVVLINVASHEWARLSLVDGRIKGDSKALSRLVSLGRLMIRWYGAAALVFAIAVSIAGAYFFANTQELRLQSDIAREQISWLAPWITLALLNAAQLLLLPLTAILEGCHQLNVVNRVRFRVGLAGTFVVWTMILCGFGLWALSASAAVRLAGESYLVLYRFRHFFDAFRDSNISDSIDWRSEILPLQWRSAVQGVVFWLATHLPLLLIFRGHNTGDAARLGMTWTILSAMQSAALSWIETRRPMFGSLIADKRYGELDKNFFSMARISVGLMAVGAVVLCLLVLVVNAREEWLFQRLAERLLPLSSAIVFGLGFIINQPGLCANIYVRAHKRDPFLVVSTLSNLALAGFQITLGWKLGVAGVAWGYLLGIGLFQTPLLTLVWWQTRREWHV